MKLRIAHLYPLSMNIYGDRGNLITLTRRCEWRGIDCEIIQVGMGQPVEFAKCDIVFVGGGQDRQQLAVSDDLLKTTKGADLKQAVADGLVLLSICGGYQLLGHHFLAGGGRKIAGTGLFDAWTEAGASRLIGNIVVDCSLAEAATTLVGFENHSGRTFLGAGVRPLGTVVSGFGNNDRDRTEGAIYHNAFGSYMHGSLLPKNPAFADHLIRLALGRRGRTEQLPPLDDRLEDVARTSVISRTVSGRKRLRFF